MENPNTPLPLDNGKTVAVVCYLTPVGWLVALILHGNAKTRLGAFHLRQMLGLMILAVAIAILRFPLFMMPFLGFGLVTALNLGILILWILGLIAAASGEEKAVPIVGDQFQKWFAGLGL